MAELNRLVWQMWPSGFYAHLPVQGRYASQLLYSPSAHWQRPVPSLQVPILAKDKSSEKKLEASKAESKQKRLAADERRKVIA